MPANHPRKSDPKPRDKKLLVSRLWRFLLRVFSHFSRNKGFLLASGIAYNMLLSLVPLIAVFLSWVSRVIDRDKVLGILNTELELFLPGQAEKLTADISSFLDQPNLFGGIGLIVLLFFSSLAFRMLQDALEVVFARPRARVKKRTFLFSAALPYIYVAVVGMVLLALTVLVISVEALAGPNSQIFGYYVGNVPAMILYVSGIIGEVVMFSSLYRVMPVAKVG
ncbi:MAG: YihY/virulence factor BrkB family protein, partial [Nannocystaceae bacterium]